MSDTAGEAWKVIEDTLALAEAREISVEVDDPLSGQIAALMREHVTAVSRERWETTLRRLTAAFGLTADTLVRLFGEGAAGVARPAIAPRVPFESLVTTGWFAEYLRWTAESEAPAQYHFGAAACLVAAALGRRPLLDWKAKRTFANLYLMLVGPSGSKKSSAIELAWGLVGGVLPINRLPIEGTHQGIADALRARYEAVGVADGVIVCDEFTVLVSKDRNKEDMAKWLTTWYDSPDVWDRALASRPGWFVGNLCVSVLGGSTPEWLRGMPRDAIIGGFMPRFIVLDAQDRRHFKADPQFDDALMVHLRTKITAAVAVCPAQIGFTPHARAWLRNWYEGELAMQIQRTHDAQVRKWLDRKQAAAMKLATVWQIADGGPTAAIEVDWLRRARAVVDWGDVSVEAVYARLQESGDGEVTADVLRTIDARGGVATEAQIVRALRGSWGLRRIREATATLQASGEIVPAGGTLGRIVWVRVRS